MLLTLVAIGLSVVLATVVNVQQVAARGDMQRADALNAAQAGIDVALAQIRAATTGTPATWRSCRSTAVSPPCSASRACCAPCRCSP